MISESCITHSTKLKAFLKTILPISKFTNLLILTEFNEYNTMSKIIMDQLKNYRDINNNISGNYKNQVKTKNFKQSRINACYKIKRFVINENVNIVPNVIVVKQLNTLPNVTDNNIINCDLSSHEPCDTLNLTSNSGNACINGNYSEINQEHFLYPRLSEIIFI